MIWHRHHSWEVAGAEFTAPMRMEAEGVPVDVFKIALLGCTTVTSVCSKCGAIKTEQHIGKVACDVGA